MALWLLRSIMSTLPEFVGTIHIFFGPYRGNPIGLYLRHEGDSCSISPTVYPWNRVVGVGETANKAAADFDAKWKEGDLAAEMYSGPHWEGGIKPEKPKPPSKPAAPKPEGTKPPEAAAPPKPDAGTAPASPTTTGESAPPSPAPSPETTPPPAVTAETDQSVS